MPFMAKAKVVLDTAESTATFKAHGTIIQCSALRQTAVATAATQTTQEEQDAMIETINRAINLANENLRDHSCSDAVTQGGKNLLAADVEQAIKIKTTNS